MYKNWYKSNSFGQLYKVIDIVYGNEPVFSIVTNDENKLFLVETIDSFAGEYIIAECGTIGILQMFEANQTIYETLKESKKVAHTMYDDDYVLRDEKLIEGSELEDGFLPNKEMYFKSFSKDVDEFVANFKEMMSKKRIDYIYNYKKTTAYHILAFDSGTINKRLRLAEINDRQMPNQTTNNVALITYLAYS